MPVDAKAGNLKGTLSGEFELGKGDAVGVRRTGDQMYLRDTAADEHSLAGVISHPAQVPAGRVLTVPAGYQLLHFGEFITDGELIIDGEMVVL